MAKSAISIKDLSAAVEHAVKIVGQKHSVQFSNELRIGPGTIIGREIVPASLDLKQAEQIATEITQHLATGTGSTAGAAALEPAVLVRRGGTICGALWTPTIEFP